MKVFITGASSGIGAAMAREYAKGGARLGLVARRADALERLASELREAGAKVHVYAADVTDASAMRVALDDFAATAAGGASSIDRVIANAGIGIGDTLRSGDAEAVAQLIRVNVIGVTNTLVPAIPMMLKQGTGTLVAVSSVAGFRGLPGRAAYSASKAAILTFMEALRMQLVGTGVHAMTLCPGFVRTPLTATLTHKLPFLMEVDEAARDMVQAVEQRKATFTLPWQMNLLRHVVAHAPEWLVRRMAPPARSQGAMSG
ncbi:MAG TPA: SDR family NAD(P)-dependent oxidoreductase [Polyangiaceae bacterium]|nr:SDR family NAD(P)-dependent oxidoreductase [Polyangiaceae bacterium]